MTGDLDGLRVDMIAALPGVHPWGEVVDRLLPVIAAWGDQRAARELREAADDEDQPGKQLLRARADALSARTPPAETP